MSSAAPVQWTVESGGNGHWYEAVTNITSMTFAGAVANAAARTFDGMTGYLATANTAQEYSFMSLLKPYGQIMWLGGSDAAQEGNWQWVTEPGGPVPIDYAMWAPGEPNNAGGSEDGLLGWWSWNYYWNDISDTYGQFGMMVEYSPTPAPVPLPASLPLLAAGLGGIAVLRRRRAAR